MWISVGMCVHTQKAFSLRIILSNRITQLLLRSLLLHSRMQKQGVWEAFNSWWSAVVTKREVEAASEWKEKVASLEREKEERDGRIAALLADHQERFAEQAKRLEEIEVSSAATRHQQAAELENVRARYDEAAGESVLLRGEVSHRD